MIQTRTLDLRSIDFVDRTIECLSKATNRYIVEHDNQPVSEMGIGMYGISGSLDIFFETLENATRQIEKYPDYVCRDISGFFNGNPADYKHCCGSLNFVEWHEWYWGSDNEYSQECSLRLVDQYGNLHEFPDQKNEPINKVACHCTVPVLQEFCKSEEFRGLHKEKLFRVGVTPWDSSCATHWLHINHLSG